MPRQPRADEAGTMLMPNHLVLQPANRMYPREMRGAAPAPLFAVRAALPPEPRTGIFILRCPLSQGYGRLARLTLGYMLPLLRS